MTPGTSGSRPNGLKAWNFALVTCAVLGLLAGFALRAFAPSWLPFVVGLVGYLSGIFAIGTSNVFQSDSSKHFKPQTQRFWTCFAAIALGASTTTLYP